jgi:hypothetical protein
MAFTGQRHARLQHGIFHAKVEVFQHDSELPHLPGLVIRVMKITRINKSTTLRRSDEGSARDPQQ